jgi:hypothetical protein
MESKKESWKKIKKNRGLKTKTTKGRTNERTNTTKEKTLKKTEKRTRQT